MQVTGWLDMQPTEFDNDFYHQGGIGIVRLGLDVGEMLKIFQVSV
jgi:hypothetical protein